LDVQNWASQHDSKVVFQAQNVLKSMAVGASPQTPLGELTALPQTPLLGFTSRMGLSPPKQKCLVTPLLRVLHMAE